MSISGFFQFIIGFILGIFLLAVSATGVAYYLFTQMAAAPPKPIFPQESQEPEAESKTAATIRQTSKQSQPEDSGNDRDTLESVPYKARVIWPQGLIMREKPTKESQRLGGIGYDWEIVILEYSEDKQWQKVRIPGNDREGWIKSGNVKKID
ncbi:MAG: SH3 domain-containing protein [Prochloraceae cyanobacterium]